MASNMQNASSKGAGSTIQSSTPSQTLTPTTASENYPRRGVGSAHGAGAASRSSSSPRNNQALRKQHRARRPKLGIDDPAIEAAAARSTSSRKGQTSITHLMNFSLPPRPQNSSVHHNSRYGGNRRPTWGLGSGYHAMDKARYIHANYRFIVDPRGSYSQHAVDPDVHLDWTNVLQILASAQSQATSCPICLSKPVAPRMAKCGHIFCLPCMIRFMHSGEETHTVPEKKSRWKSCPICWDSIYMSDLRPVRWFQGQEGEPPIEGGDVVLRLIMRQPGSVIALPKDEARNSLFDDDVPWYFAAEVTDYARIMKGSEEYMLTSFAEEIEEIRQQEQEDQLIFGEENSWTNKAINGIRDMMEKYRGIGSPPEESRGDPDGDSSKGNAIISHNQNQKKSSASAHNLASSFTGSSRSERSDNAFFFYQALLHYYLSPLDIRILKAAFGDYSTFPATILPRVERVSTGHIVDDDLRKRAKYLGHLPSGCEVGFLECDWRDIVPEKVLEGFAGEIERRRKRNREKEAREEKERLRAEREEDDKRWAAARRRKPRDTSPVNFTSGVVPESAESYNLGSSNNSNSPPWNKSLHQNESAFASLASPSTSPGAPRTVWGTAAIASASPDMAPTRPAMALENDGWLQDWERDLLNEEENLVAQVEATSLQDEGVSRQGNHGTSNKKKKNKKITLMSTNARRAA